MHKRSLPFLAAAVGALIVSAPAQGQYYPPQGGVAGDIERGAAAAAEAVTAVSQMLRGTRESLGVGACRIQAARYGSASVVDVRPKGRRNLRVRGYIEPVAQYGQWGSRYDRAYQRRSYDCIARPDGSISKFKTKRLRR
ncbi:MAG TPA: hypothetical protein VGD10_00860 [Allosphingosinicella sp.]|uniref:hypothetical protein n=1 Tax=Allosphingosinicella sp. TaxID=2823234 RepID=UPI002ED7B469